MSLLYPCLPKELLASEVSADYYTHPPGIVSLLMLTMVNGLYIYIHRASSTTIQHAALQDHGHSNQCRGWIKTRNSVPRTGLEPTYLASLASVLPSHPAVTTIPTPTCLCSSLPHRAVQTITILSHQLIHK